RDALAQASRRDRGRREKGRRYGLAAAQVRERRPRGTGGEVSGRGCVGAPGARRRRPGTLRGRLRSRLERVARPCPPERGAEIESRAGERVTLSVGRRLSHARKGSDYGRAQPGASSI